MQERENTSLNQASDRMQETSGSLPPAFQARGKEPEGHPSKMDNGFTELQTAIDLSNMIRTETDPVQQLELIKRADQVGVSVFPMIRSPEGQLEALSKLQIDCYIFSPEALRDFILPRTRFEEVKQEIERLYEAQEGIFNWDDLCGDGLDIQE